MAWCTSRAMAASTGRTSRPKDMPEWIQINSIDASTLRRRHGLCGGDGCTSSDDFRPYLFKTSDYGKTWTKIVNGIPEHSLHARGARKIRTTADC